LQPVINRIVAYLLAGLSAGLMAWIPVCGAPFPGIQTSILLIAGIVLPALVTAFVLLRRVSFQTNRGGMTVSSGQILASDLTCMTAAAVAAFFVIDGFSERLGGPRACIADPLAADVIAFMFLPATAVLALFVSQTGAQRIRADENGLSVEGVSGSKHAAWDEIVSFHPQRQHVLVGRVGFFVPRHLRTNIVVGLRNGGSARIFDPSTFIANTLADHVEINIL
jgi:hypothetical protein